MRIRLDPDDANVAWQQYLQVFFRTAFVGHDLLFRAAALGHPFAVAWQQNDASSDPRCVFMSAEVYRQGMDAGGCGDSSHLTPLRDAALLGMPEAQGQYAYLLYQALDPGDEAAEDQARRFAELCLKQTDDARAAHVLAMLSPDASERLRLLAHAYRKWGCLESARELCHQFRQSDPGMSVHLSLTHLRDGFLWSGDGGWKHILSEMMLSPWTQLSVAQRRTVFLIGRALSRVVSGNLILTKLNWNSFEALPMTKEESDASKFAIVAAREIHRGLLFWLSVGKELVHRDLVKAIGRMAWQPMCDFLEEMIPFEKEPWF